MPPPKRGIRARLPATLPTTYVQLFPQLPRDWKRSG
jgi:hypothetical protein